MAYDPSEALATIERPVLAITGAKNIQVDCGDVTRIGEIVTGRFDGEVPAISPTSSGAIPDRRAWAPIAGSCAGRSTRGSSIASPSGRIHRWAEVRRFSD